MQVINNVSTTAVGEQILISREELSAAPSCTTVGANTTSITITTAQTYLKLSVVWKNVPAIINTQALASSSVL